MRRKKAAALLAVPLMFLLASCGGNGWDAYPVDEPSGCYQITEWKSNGWSTKTWARGLYCPAVVTPAPERSA
jgi:hypothetical protein